MPGLIKTNFSKPIQSAVPEKFHGTSEQLGSVMATICSDDGSFMKGTIVKVDGAYSVAKL